MRERTTKVDRRLYKLFALNLIVSFLEKRAAQGWRLTKLDSYNAAFGSKGLKYTFTRSEPTQLRFAAEFLASGFDLNKDLTVVTPEYVDYCQAAGWQFVGSVDKIYIFYSDDLNADPIETDQVLKLGNIHKTMFKKLKIGMFFCFVGIVYLLLTFWFASTFILSSFISFFDMTFWFFFVLVWLLDALKYLFWYKKAKWLVDQGEQIPFAKDSQISIGPLLLSYFYVGAFLLSAAMFHFDGSAYVFQMVTIALLLLIILNVLLVVVSVKGAGHFVKVFSILSPVIIIFLLTFAWSSSDFGSSSTTHPKNLPLELSDLNLATIGQSTYSHDSNYPFLIWKGNYFESNRLADGDVGLSYTVYETKLAFLVPVILHQEFLSNIRLHQDFQEIAADDFNAAAVYVDRTSGAMSNYLFVFADRIVYVNPTWELTPAQMQLIGAKLGLTDN